MTHYNYGPEGYGYEMSEKERPWPSQSGSLSGSHPSLYSFYTPSNSTYILPIAQELPDLSKKTDDYMGFAICSLMVNPLFGFFAILASEKSKECYYRCSYRKARQYGQYAKGFALGGIIVMIIVYFLIGFAVFNHYRRFYMW